MAGLWPHAVVLVVTARALRFHGGDQPGLDSIERGFANVRRHLAAIRAFGLTPIVSLNVFATDTDDELALVERLVKTDGAAVARNDGFVKGGEGSVAIADLVMKALEGQAPTPNYSYALTDSFEDKVRGVAKRVYGAKDIELTQDARKDLERITAWGLGHLPVCMAKTHLSLSDDPSKQGAPTDFTITVRQVRVSAGAGFLLALTGEILTMPGLPKVPSSVKIDLTDDGEVTGVS
jgi:formate--tetrahydrofolate ligase